MSKVSKGRIIDDSFEAGELVESNGKIYDCILNQTEIDSNKNKFYIMQLIQNGPQYKLWVRYGRTGEKGKTYSDIFQSEQVGISTFEKQFKTKTGNAWGTSNFTKKKGKYFMSEISYADELKNIPVSAISVPDSKLDQRVQNLIKMLSDINMMKNALVSLDIDTKKMPLGKIKQNQLDKAGEVLDKVQPIINLVTDPTLMTDKLIFELTELSSEYYTFLPMSCGRNKPPVINSIEMLSKYRDTLDELRNIVITTQITENIKSGDNPIDSVYNSINTKINPMDKNNHMWAEIEKYIGNTHGPTHECKLNVLDIFEIEQNDKGQKYQKSTENIGNKTLLYHGTPQGCVLSIFKQDFYLDPSKLTGVPIQIAGKMFGYGVYFADSSKSFGYTRAYQTDDIGCYIIAEVALGKQMSKFDADYHINKNILEKKGYQSTKGEGRWQPSLTEEVDGVKIPNGKLQEVHKNASLRYNEYIVYDIDQILIKYLVVLKNNGNYKGM